jgi:hypothetical protein
MLIFLLFFTIKKNKESQINFYERSQELSAILEEKRASQTTDGLILSSYPQTCSALQIQKDPGISESGSFPNFLLNFSAGILGRVRPADPGIPWHLCRFDPHQRYGREQDQGNHRPLCPRPLHQDQVSAYFCSDHLAYSCHREIMGFLFTEFITFCCFFLFQS